MHTFKSFGEEQLDIPASKRERNIGSFGSTQEQIRYRMDIVGEINILKGSMILKGEKLGETYL